jgi:hypothetical protein
MLIPRALRHQDISGRVLMLVTYSEFWADLAPVDLSLGWQQRHAQGSTITEHDGGLLVVSTDHSIQNYYPLQVRGSKN